MGTLLLSLRKEDGGWGRVIEGLIVLLSPGTGGVGVPFETPIRPEVILSVQRSLNCPPLATLLNSGKPRTQNIHKEQISISRDSMKANEPPVA